MSLGWSDADVEALHVLRPLLENCPCQGGKHPFAPSVAHQHPRGYLPWTEGALRPAALVAVCNEIALGNRRQVVELGSGISTVVLARLMRERGGGLTSLEHDPSWARLVCEQLEREELTSLATVIEARLEPHPAALGGAPWYPADAVSQLPDAIDLLLVDGPPGYGEGMEASRYPALPALADRLAEGALVVLDDAERPGEQAILEFWQASGEWRFGERPDEGIAVGARAAAA